MSMSSPRDRDLNDGPERFRSPVDNSEIAALAEQIREERKRPTKTVVSAKLLRAKSRYAKAE